MIPFNRPPYTGRELDYMAQAVLVNHKLCGDGPFTQKCHALLEQQTGSPRVLLTTSGSDALEMAAQAGGRGHHALLHLLLHRQRLCASGSGAGIRGRPA